MKKLLSRLAKKTANTEDRQRTTFDDNERPKGIAGPHNADEQLAEGASADPALSTSIHAAHMDVSDVPAGRAGEPPVASSGIQAGPNIMGSRIEAGNNLNISSVGVGQMNVFNNFQGPADPSILKRLHADLEPVDSAAYDAYSSKIGQCFEGTRVALLQDIQAWIGGNGTQASVYILDGVAGIGKSTVAQTIAFRAAQSNVLGASFLFTRNEEQRMTTRRFVPTIAFQLASHRPTFASELASALDQHPDAIQKTIKQQFSLLIMRPLQSLSEETSPILIVIDALDECNSDEAVTLLKLLASQAHTLPHLKIFITSRPETPIRRVLDQDKNHERFHLHEIEASIVRSDIRHYLDYHLSLVQLQSHFPELEISWQPSPKEMKLLSGVCGTLFIIASTAVKFVTDDLRCDPSGQMTRLLQGISFKDFSGSHRMDVMDTIYMQILMSALPPKADREDQEFWFARFQTVVGALITIQNPLPAQSLASLLGISANEVEIILRPLHSLVAPNKERIFRVHHKTFPDFITNLHRIDQAFGVSGAQDTAQGASRFLIATKEHHTRLAKHCFRVMLRKLKHNMGNLDSENWYKFNEEVEDVLSAAVPKQSDLAYASIYWVSHLELGEFDKELQDQLRTWTTTRLLAWIEVLSILGQLKNVHHMLLAARTVIANAQDWDAGQMVAETLNDLSTLAERSHDILTQSSMHLHWSVAPFIPTEIVGKNTLKSEMGRLKIVAGVEQCWGASAISVLRGHSDYVRQVEFSPDGSRLASASEDGTIGIWDGKTGAPIDTLEGHLEGVSSISFSPDGSILASGSFDFTVKLWDWEVCTLVATLEGHSGEIRMVTFSPDGSRLASGSSDHTVRLWDGRSGTLIATLEGHSDLVMSLAFSPSGSRLVSSSYDNTIKLWQGAAGTHLATLDFDTSSALSVVFSPDGRRLLSGSVGGLVQIWDGETGAHYATLEGHSEAVNCVVVSPDGSRLASASDDCTIRLWDYAGIHITTLVGHTASVNSAVFSPDGAKLASVSEDCTIRIWDGRSGDHIITLGGHSDTTIHAVFSANGQRLASASWDQSVRLWNLDTDNSSYPSPSPGPPPGHSSQILSVSFTTDGSKLASASEDNTIRVWDGRTATHISTMIGHSEEVNEVVFSPDGQRLASASGDKTLRVWDVDTGATLFVLEGHSDAARCVAFSADGLIVASGSLDKTICLWDCTTGLPITTLNDHTGTVVSVAFSNGPDHARFASSASRESTARLRDGKTGASIAPLPGHANNASVVKFSPDDRKLISVDRDNTVRFWDGLTGMLLSSTSLQPYADETWYIAFPSTTLLDPPESERVIYREQHLLFGLIEREPPISGLVSVYQKADDWATVPFLWMPQHLKIRALAVNNTGNMLALGCHTGQLILLDISRVQLPHRPMVN